MTANEILTLTLSAFAILLSSVGLYIQFWHRKAIANFRLIGVSYSEDEELGMTLQYMVSNYGNLDLLLTDVEIVSGNSDKGTGEEGYSVLAYKCDDFPQIKSNRFFLEQDTTYFTTTRRQKWKKIFTQCFNSFLQTARKKSFCITSHT